MNSIQEKEFRRRQISFVGLLSAITVILLGLHYYIYYYFAASIDLKIPLWTVYAFHFIAVLLIYSFINYRHTSGKTDVFNVFMILTFLKMILAVVFLLPVLLSSLENKVPDVLNFFFPYFIYLGLEVWTVTNFLKEKTN
jgi:signal transduction histidine kinase